jgi:hypothetical protein
MKKTSVILTILAALMLISCSKPVEKMDIRLLFTIDGNIEPKTVQEYEKKFTVISDIEVDREGIIYLFNPRLERIMKFTPEGEYLRYFGARGTGKGEFMNAMDFTILDDTVYVKNTYTNIIIRNSLEGEYIDYFEDKTGRFGFGEVLKAISSDRMIGYIGTSDRKDDKKFVTNRLSILDKKLNEIKSLREYSSEIDRNNSKFFEYITKYAFGSGKIYVAENEDEGYNINIYDYEGEKLGAITRKYGKVRYNRDELKTISQMPVAVRKTKDELDTLQSKPVYKKSINDLFLDKNGRLFVCPSVERNEKNKNDFIADIFENGSFVKRVVIPQLKGEDFLYRNESKIYFIGDRIFEILHKEMKINVYEY